MKKTAKTDILNSLMVYSEVLTRVTAIVLHCGKLRQVDEFCRLMNVHQMKIVELAEDILEEV